MEVLSSWRCTSKVHESLRTLLSQLWASWIKGRAKVRIELWNHPVKEGQMASIEVGGVAWRRDPGKRDWNIPEKKGRVASALLQGKHSSWDPGRLLVPTKLPVWISCVSSWNVNNLVLRGTEGHVIEPGRESGAWCGILTRGSPASFWLQLSYL